MSWRGGKEASPSKKWGGRRQRVGGKGDKKVRDQTAKLIQRVCDRRRKGVGLSAGRSQRKGGHIFQMAKRGA